MGKSLKKFALGAGLMGLLGYLTGLLTAPKTGKQTRQDIKRAAQQGVNEAEQQLSEKVDELSQLLDRAKKEGERVSGKTAEELEDLTQKAKIARDKATTVLTAIREGKTEDQDLNLAVEQAAHSLKHLRDYLKK